MSSYSFVGTGLVPSPVGRGRLLGPPLGRPLGPLLGRPLGPLLGRPLGPLLGRPLGRGPGGHGRQRYAALILRGRLAISSSYSSSYSSSCSSSSLSLPRRRSGGAKMQHNLDGGLRHPVGRYDGPYDGLYDGG